VGTSLDVDDGRAGLQVQQGAGEMDELLANRGEGVEREKSNRQMEEIARRQRGGQWGGKWGVNGDREVKIGRGQQVNRTLLCTCLYCVHGTPMFASHGFLPCLHP